MQKKRGSNIVRFGRVAPNVPVKDLDRTLRFYRDLLGFEVQFTNGDPISFAVVKQGDAELHLVVQPAKAGSLHVHLMVDDVGPLYDRLQQYGATIRQAPKVQPWGLRDMIVLDPDGNSFEIAQPIGVAQE